MRHFLMFFHCFGGTLPKNVTAMEIQGSEISGLRLGFYAVSYPIMFIVTNIENPDTFLCS